MAHYVYNIADSYKTNEILITMGNDFEWQDAGPEFSAMDDLIAYFQVFSTNISLLSF